ncbi:MAG TPA: PaaI family thioesterase [Thermoplasmata archaeon]|nr:PaaI family thioesterase [Thermoplasmata archaeon]
MPGAARPDPRPIRPPREWGEIARLGGFHREVGFSIDPARTGRGVCTVAGAVERRHLNINGVVHGGVYATILDTAMGGAVVSLLADGEVTATTSLYVEFLRPAQEGQTLTARGEVVRRGRHLAFVRGDLSDGDGTLLSQAHGTWYIWSHGDGTWSRGRQRAPPASAATGRRADARRRPGSR